MENRTSSYTSIDEYIVQFPAAVQQLLNTLRTVIQEEAPDSIERIAYGMPTFHQFGNVCHFAAFKNHIGFFPGANGVAEFLPELTEYKTSKGTIQFPYSKPMPLDLVRRIVRFRVIENITWHQENLKSKKPIKKREQGF
jgi:uncharacterized protein YdhG (YjbR/CyaY superfamily)